jgi:hypothetical protein
VNIEILHIDDCPNWEEAGRRVRAALDASNIRDAGITYRLLPTREAGSPTILLDGVEAFPTDGRTSDLACRIYRTPTGYAGVPTLDQLVEALTQHQ